MGDDESRKESRTGVYDEIVRARRAFFAAKREARQLKSGMEPGHPHDDLETHPWIRASRETKNRAGDQRGSSWESEDAQRMAAVARRRVWWVGAAFVTLVVLAGLGLTRTVGVRSGEIPAPSVQAIVHVWHDVSGPEEAHLDQLAKIFSSGAVAVALARQPNIEQAVRRGIFARQPPDVAIVDEPTARELAALGVLQPPNLPDGAQAERLYLPLGSPSLWSRPLVAIVLKNPDATIQSQFSRGFARFLQEKLNSGSGHNFAPPP